MELGEKLRQARLDAGLSQRQLCGEQITRNMLSQIEHGTAKPSMKTLQYLAGILGKSVDYFLTDDEPAPEAETAQMLSDLQRAEDAIAQGKNIYAAKLLEGTDASVSALMRQKLLLQARLPGADVPELLSRLPSLDEELLLRAEGAMALKRFSRAVHLLEAMEDHSGPRWHILRGKLYMVQRDYRSAAVELHKAEKADPEGVYPLLEQCYREMEDYKQAYYYACKQK